MINSFIRPVDQKHFINEYQEHCDVIQNLNHVEEWVLAIVKINLAGNWQKGVAQTNYS